MIKCDLVILHLYQKMQKKKKKKKKKKNFGFFLSVSILSKSLKDVLLIILIPLIQAIRV